MTYIRYQSCKEAHSTATGMTDRSVKVKVLPLESRTHITNQLPISADSSNATSMSDRKKNNE